LRSAWAVRLLGAQISSAVLRSTRGATAWTSVCRAWASQASAVHDGWKMSVSVLSGSSSATRLTWGSGSLWGALDSGAKGRPGKVAERRLLVASGCQGGARSSFCPGLGAGRSRVQILSPRFHEVPANPRVLRLSDRWQPSQAGSNWGPNYFRTWWAHPRGCVYRRGRSMIGVSRRGRA
jgi:hypothetical protein